MARRRGRFSRGRRPSSNLSALVAQLMREQRAAEDQAIFDAYNNGGLYKGKPVTDDVILKYIEKRRDGFDTQDPLYDQWNNRLIQTKFIIGEQKIGLLYKQGKVGAGAVAAYYRKALKDIPKNSAFYRDVAGRAATWAKGAARAAGGRARSRATAALRTKLNQQLIDQQGYLSLEAGLTAYARARGLISGTQTLADASATALQDMFRQGLYAGSKQITWADFVRAARGYYTSIGAEIKTRVQMGQQATEAYSKRSRFLNDKLIKFNVMDERESYESARNNWLEARAAAGDDPYANAAADAEYATALKNITASVQPGLTKYSEDAEFLGGLTNEIELLETGKSQGATVSDIYDYDGPGSKEMAASFESMQNDVKLLESGQAYLGQSEPGGSIHVVKWQSGLGKDPLGLDDSLQPSVTNVDGNRRLVYLKGKAVLASVYVDDAGNRVDPGEDPNALREGLRNGTIHREASQAPVGYQFTDANGNIKYGVIDKATGNMVFTDENPWGSDVQQDGGQLYVDSSAVVEYGPNGGKFKPDVNAVYGTKLPPSLATADPLLADSTVSPTDLLNLVKAGDLKLSDTDLASYKNRLAYEAAASTTYGSPDRVDERYKTNLQDNSDIEQKRLGAGYGVTQAIRSTLGVEFAAAHHTVPAAPPPVHAMPIAIPTNPTKKQDVEVEPPVPNTYQGPQGPNPYNSGLGGEPPPTTIGDTPPPGVPIGGK